MPDVLASSCKTEGLEAHGLIGHIARENEEVCPGNLVAVFLLDGPQQSSGLVEIGIVRPAVEWSKSLVSCIAPSSSVGNPVRSCGMPGHSYHQSAIMTPVGGPPILAIGHKGFKIALQSLQIQLFEFFRIIKVSSHWVAFDVMLMQDV